MVGVVWMCLLDQGELSSKGCGSDVSVCTYVLSSTLRRAKEGGDGLAVHVLNTVAMIQMYRFYSGTRGVHGSIQGCLWG